MTYLDYQSANYVDPRAIRLNRIFFRVALACGILPMTVSIIVFVLRLFFDWEFLPFVSLLMVPIGTFIALTGIGLAITWCIQQHRIAKRLHSPTRWRIGSLVLLLLLVSFPVVFSCAYVGLHLAIRPIVDIIIVNETDADLTEFTAGFSSLLHSQLRLTRSLSPGETRMHVLFKRQSCKPLRIQVEQNGASKELTLIPPPPSTRFGSTDLKIHVKPNLELDHEFVPHPSP